MTDWASDAHRRRRIFALFLDATLRRGTPYWWRPRGVSMHPTIVDGQRVLIVPADPRTLRIGDVVKFTVEGQLTLHRLVGRRRRRDGGLDFAFRGDNASVTEGPVPDSSVIGVAAAVDRDGTLVSLRSPRARLTGLLRIARGYRVRA
jgi:hypothetical protein